VVFNTVLLDYAGNNSKLATAVAYRSEHITNKRPWVFSWCLKA